MYKKILNYFSLFVIIFSSCSKDEIDVGQANSEFTKALEEVNFIKNIEKYDGFYYLKDDIGKEYKLAAKEYAAGILYVQNIEQSESSYSFVLSDGGKHIIQRDSSSQIKYRLPNVSTLRTDGYDIVIELILNSKSELLRINHGEPNIGGYVCSTFVDFGRGKIGLYLPYMISEEKTDEVLMECDQDIDFSVGHHYTIVSSKINGCVISMSIRDDATGQIYQYVPDVLCYDSGITNGWGISSYENSGQSDVLSFKVYSNQPYNSKLLILGDSNADHGGLGNNKMKNYARQIKEEMQGDVFIVAQGGAKTDNFLLWMDHYALDVCSPKYCLITTYNEYSFNKWNKNIQEIIRILDSRNIIPILATIHPGEGEVICYEKQKINDWIRNSGYLVFDIAHVISKDNDGLTTAEDLLIPPTFIHYTPMANNLLAAEFFRNFPFFKANN